MGAMIDTTDYRKAPVEAALWAEGYKAGSTGVSARLAASFSAHDGRPWLEGYGVGAGKKAGSYRPRMNPYLGKKRLAARLLRLLNR